MINIILLILILISIYYYFNKSKETIDNNKSHLDEYFFNNKKQEKYCDFTYYDINSYYEKKQGVIIKPELNTDSIQFNNIKSWVPNIYFDSETQQNKQFNNTNQDLLNENMIYKKDNSITSPNLIPLSDNKTIKEIYDDSILDYKKNIPKKKLNNNNIIQCGSNLNILSPNDWNYDNESSLNGGEIINGLYGYDPLTNQCTSMC